VLNTTQTPKSISTKTRMAQSGTIGSLPHNSLVRRAGYPAFAGLRSLAGLPS
jgi:hypothetical protein